ncbi:hypothetical protein RHSIM_Rhsim04G0194600 [Rhododendron simsii]|uniref:F-box associated domain-containing protein n=1 Tax=Rhododendron simsii TaxID=118357 RepID=A0A834H2L6_RHOSS|nr:hypothetical protein RHSIM_Rhsim04G0194600 [Rhododendron simsii]
MPRLLELGGHLAACVDPEAELELEELWILEDYDNWVWIEERIMLPPDCNGPSCLLIHTYGLNQIAQIRQVRSSYMIYSRLSPSLEIYSYGPNKRSSRKIHITGLPKYAIINVFNYVEDLFSLRDI